MQLRIRWIIVILLSVSAGTASAQGIDSLRSKPDSLFTFSDSLSIFHLIDSLMALEDDLGSQLAFRLGYNSNILAAGRTLGIEQFGLSPAITYYHKSGLYADVTAYWSQDFDPHLYLTTASVGYIHLFSDRFSVTANFDHYFYNYGDDYFIPFSNAAGLSPLLELGPVSLRLDYSFYFGDAYANRILPGVSGNIRKKDFLGFDRISFYPAVYILFGDELITEIEIVKPSGIIEAAENIRKYGDRNSYRITERKVFGLMNYAFSAPLYLTKGNWQFNLSYTYSIPRPVDNEPLTFTNTGFVSASVVFYVQFGPASLQR